MKLIAIDTSGLVAGVALWEDGTLVAEYTVNYKKTHSQTLLPMLDELRKMTELDLEEVDAIAVAAGPGSFTGLRIGSATAKGMGLALEIPIIAVPTLDAMAYHYYGAAEGDIICPIMDARRQQVYTGIYCFTEVAAGSALPSDKEKAAVREMHPLAYDMKTILPSCAMMITDLVEKLNGLDGVKRVIFLGDGVPVYRQAIMENMKVPYFFAPAGSDRQRAASVALLGSEYFTQGKVQTAAEHAPVYLRMSQAERERLEAEKRENG